MLIFCKLPILSEGIPFDRMGKVLVLNQDYSALSVCTVPKAFLLIYMNKEEMFAESSEHFMHT